MSAQPWKVEEEAIRHPYNRRFRVRAGAQADPADVLRAKGIPVLRDPHPRHADRTVAEVRAESFPGYGWAVHVTYTGGDE